MARLHPIRFHNMKVALTAGAFRRTVKVSVRIFASGKNEKGGLTVLALDLKIGCERSNLHETVDSTRLGEGRELFKVRAWDESGSDGRTDLPNLLANAVIFKRLSCVADPFLL